MSSGRPRADQQQAVRQPLHEQSEALRNFGSSNREAIERLARRWHQVVGRERVAHSQPIGIVGDQLIVEVARAATFSAQKIASAVDALGRDDVREVVVRVVDRLNPQVAMPVRAKTRQR